MSPPATPPGRYAPEQLLGPLSEAERRHAPEWLYAEGDLGLLRGAARVAIVGTRKSSPEGDRRARKLAAQLAREGILVASGLAAGIDTAAHEAAIAAGGRTLAVIGTPLDQAYPRQNRDLQRRIAAEHLLLSPFAPGAPVSPANFPKRNQVTVLIAQITVILEAGERSGTRQLGWEAIRLGRPLLLARSLVDAPGLTWPAKMLGYGAQVLDDLGSIMRLLPFIEGTGFPLSRE